MKKLYATPTVEFTGFDVEDVITVSIQTLADPGDEAAINAVMTAVGETGITANYEQAEHYSSYTW